MLKEYSLYMSEQVLFAMKSYHLIGVAGIVIGVNYFCDLGFWKNFFADFVLLVVIPVLVLTRGKGWAILKKYGIAYGTWKWWMKRVAGLLLVSLPIMYYGAGLPEFVQYYPWYPPARYSWSAFFLFELSLGGLMAATEFFYRGFLLFGLAEKVHPTVANIVHSFIYMVMHIGKPWLEVPYSFAAGFVFGYIDYKGKSILPSLVMHWGSSILFDLLILLR
jgi:membrane protease YdiL (CAAX protease family)